MIVVSHGFNSYCHCKEKMYSCLGIAFSFSNFVTGIPRIAQTESILLFEYLPTHKSII